MFIPVTCQWPLSSPLEPFWMGERERPSLGLLWHPPPFCSPAWNALKSRSPWHATVNSLKNLVLWHLLAKPLGQFKIMVPSLTNVIKRENGVPKEEENEQIQLALSAPPKRLSQGRHHRNFGYAGGLALTFFTKPQFCEWQSVLRTVCTIKSFLLGAMCCSWSKCLLWLQLSSLHWSDSQITVSRLCSRCVKACPNSLTNISCCIAQEALSRPGKVFSASGKMFCPGEKLSQVVDYKGWFVPRSWSYLRYYLLRVSAQYFLSFLFAFGRD